MSRSLIIFSFILTISVTVLSQGREYVARYLPNDSINFETYKSNPRLFALQMKCILYEGPCDAVGRWIKPRITPGLLGECILCTPKQRDEMIKLLTFVQEERPELFREAIVKYLEKKGIDVPERHQGVVTKTKANSTDNAIQSSNTN